MQLFHVLTFGSVGFRDGLGSEVLGQALSDLLEGKHVLRLLELDLGIATVEI